MGAGSSFHTTPKHIRNIIKTEINEKVKPLKHKGSFAFPFHSKTKFYKINVFQSQDESSKYNDHMQEISTFSNLHYLCLPCEIKLIDNYVLTTFPLYNHDLFELHNKLTFTQLANITIDLMQVVCDLHSMGLVHGDIKPENILINKDYKPVLCDLDSLCSPQGVLRVGTEYYSPPIGLFKEAIHMGKKKDASWFEVYAMFDLFALGHTIQKLMYAKSSHNIHFQNFWQACAEILISTNLRYFYSSNNKKVRAVDLMHIMRYYNIFPSKQMKCDCLFRDEWTECDFCYKDSINDTRVAEACGNKNVVIKCG